MPGGGAPARAIESDPPEGADGVDRTARIRVRFDRPLAPRSITRSTVSLHSGPAQPFLEVRLDPVRDAIVARPFRGASLVAGVLYRLEIAGVRDLDGVEAEPFTLSFTTGESVTEPPLEGTTPWEAVAPLFAAHCVEGCHDAESAAAGVELGSLEATRATAVGVLSPQTGGTGAIDLRGLGGMARIEPGDPARSYLVYKMLGDPHIWGRPMPLEGPLPRDEVALVADWILGGAR